MTEAEIRRRLASGLAHNALATETHQRSAVLVPVEAGRGVWLTRRSVTLSSHAGQISFPGGKIERDDPSVEAAALREAAEEIGLDPAAAEILGRMDEFVTGTGFHISPVVALVPPGVGFSPAAGEVAEVFFMPFSVLLDGGVVRRSAYWRGRPREFGVWFFEPNVIWGATAMILLNLARRLGAET